MAMTTNQMEYSRQTKWFQMKKDNEKKKKENTGDRDKLLNISGNYLRENNEI